MKMYAITTIIDGKEMFFNQHKIYGVSEKAPWEAVDDYGEIIPEIALLTESQMRAALSELAKRNFKVTVLWYDLSNPLFIYTDTKASKILDEVKKYDGE